MDQIKIKGKVNTAICYARVVEEEAIEQIRRMCDYPMTVGSRIRIMPDVHAGKGCTIGHSAIIHGCTIGNNSLIGMGATVLNGAVIGRNCLIGANALVTEGKVFPDNSLIVGAPAKAVRVLDAEAVEGLKRSADSYVRNWQRFRKGLTPIG